MTKGLSLEDVIGQVYTLRNDLSAKIILQEEEGYDEHVPAETFWAYGNWSVSCDQTCRVVTRSEESVPDTQKRESAKNQLTEIYGSSEWYSARYAAGLALFEESQFRDNIGLWLKEIKAKLGSISESYERTIGHACGGWPGWDQPITEMVDVPDDGPRVDAVKDLARLYELSRIPALKKELKDVYSNNESWVARVEAGEQLGYSRLRIKLHEMIRPD
ncbi:MAG: hypothetical protein KKE20_00615 [Nanoarchaeota archaeon]|nr:hypothetical protein [Nanoarchaeota archaeon]